MLKLERRRLTNFSSRSYSTNGMYINKEQDSETEIMTKQQMEMGDSFVQNNYSNGSDEAEKKICETLQNELENQLICVPGNLQSKHREMYQKQKIFKCKSSIWSET